MRFRMQRFDPSGVVVISCPCAGCAASICDSGNACVVCNTQLDSSNVSVEVYKDPEQDLSHALCGLPPAEVIKVRKAACGTVAKPCWWHQTLIRRCKRR